MRSFTYSLFFLSLLCFRGIFGGTITPQTPRRRRSVVNQNRSPLGSHVIYVSPEPGALYTTPVSGIIIRSDENISAGTVHSDLLTVVGSISGKHDGTVIVSDDQRTILFQSEVPFALGETVTVSMAGQLLSLSEDKISLHPFSFSVSNNDLNVDKSLISHIGYGVQNLQRTIAGTTPPSHQIPNSAKEIQPNVQVDTLPSDFPILSVTTLDNPTPGYIFLSTNMEGKATNNYFILADNFGNPVSYHKLTSGSIWDFNLQPSGVLTYLTAASDMHYVMNTTFQVIDSIAPGNGYVNDGHELRILPNGNIFLLADDYESIHMNEIVSGGNYFATVIGMVIQELDKNKHVIFQWRSFDHFNITDALGQNLDSTVVDPVHSNAIEIDTDGNILLSSRHLSEITKIDINTGNIIWRLGGKNNQFNFVNDSVGFSYQHDIRRLPNGDITLMDNGNMHTPPFSRAVEYKLDEVNKTATLVWQFRHNPDVYNPFMGNVQRLANGNTLIGWGGATIASVTEVRPDGSIAFEMSLPDTVLSYRMHRYPYLILTSPSAGDTIRSGSLAAIRWSSSGVDTIGIEFTTDGGSTWSPITENYPAIFKYALWRVPEISSSLVEVKIVESGLSDIGLSFVSDTFSVVGNLADVKSSTSPYSFALLDNYPNPFNPTTTVGFSLKENSAVSLDVFNVLGQEVEKLNWGKIDAGAYTQQLNMERFSSGVYFYKITAKGSDGEMFTSMKKMVLLK